MRRFQFSVSVASNFRTLSENVSTNQSLQEQEQEQEQALNICSFSNSRKNKRIEYSLDQAIVLGKERPRFNSVQFQLEYVFFFWPYSSLDLL